MYVKCGRDDKTHMLNDMSFPLMAATLIPDWRLISFWIIHLSFVLTGPVDNLCDWSKRKHIAPGIFSHLQTGIMPEATAPLLEVQTACKGQCFPVN